MSLATRNEKMKKHSFLGVNLDKKMKEQINVQETVTDGCADPSARVKPEKKK